MAAQTFGSVWYLPHENRRRDLNILAYRETGTLTVSENSIEFHGAKETVVIRNIKRVTLGKQRRAFVTIGSKLNTATALLPRWLSLRMGACTPGAAYLEEQRES
jgi:hypothetical protein